MTNFIPSEYEKIISALLGLKAAEEEIFLVGGAVRDLLLNTLSHDLDFIVCGNVRRFARRTADYFGGAFYMLDGERDTARVICQLNSIDNLVMDFAVLRAQNLEDDLKARDFTINAMALDITKPNVLIDPLGGMKHINEKVLLSCSPHAFIDDALRILRGIRLALSYNYRIQPGVLQEMKDAVSLLPSISVERIRDELFRMLAGGKAAASVRLMHHVGVLDFFLPELKELINLSQPAPHVLDAWEHSLATMKALDSLLEVVVDSSDDNAGGKNLFLGMAMLGLRCFRDKLNEYLSESISAQRTRRDLLFFAALYHDISKPAVFGRNEQGKITFYQHEKVGAEITYQRARALALSQTEAQYLKEVVYHHMRLHYLAGSGSIPDRRVIHRFFRAAGAAGIGVCLLSLADTMATYQNTLDQTVWTRELEVCKALLASWWHRQDEIVDPPRLLTGDDIIEKFHLQPGPAIGRILRDLREAQAVCEINDRNQAFDFVDNWLRGGYDEEGESDA